MPGPRKEVRAVRLALSKLDLKTRRTPSASVTASKVKHDILTDYSFTVGKTKAKIDAHSAFAQCALLSWWDVRLALTISGLAICRCRVPLAVV